jgi:hypothetical protein
MEPRRDTTIFPIMVAGVHAERTAKLKALFKGRSEQHVLSREDNGSGRGKLEIWSGLESESHHESSAGVQRVLKAADVAIDVHGLSAQLTQKIQTHRPQPP